MNVTDIFEVVNCARSMFTEQLEEVSIFTTNRRIYVFSAKDINTAATPDGPSLFF
jgi:hypothetical protein